MRLQPTSAVLRFGHRLRRTRGSEAAVGGYMLRSFLIATLILVPVCSHAEERDWEWVSGGDFNTIAVQNGGTGDPSGDAVWMSGNLLVRGIRDQNEWVWTQVAPELTENTWVASLAFSDDGAGAMLRTVHGIAHSADGGTTWTTHSYPEWIESLASFQMTSATGAYAVGRHTDGRAILVQTNNGGAGWDLVYDSGDWPGNFLDLWIAENGHATLVGNYYSSWMGWLGVVVETENDFETVSRTDYDDQALWALEAPTADDRYALGGPDLTGSQRPIFVYRHGEGAGWITSTLPADVFQIEGMTFDSALHGWVVGHFKHAEIGSGGVLLETDDGGETWTRTDFCHNCVTELPMVEEPMPLPDSVALAGDTLLVAQSAGGWPCTTGMCTGRVMARGGDGQWRRVDRLTGLRYVDMDLAQGTLEGIAVGFDGHPWRSVSQTLESGKWQQARTHFVDCPFLGSCPPQWSEVHIVDGTEVWTTVKIVNNPARVMRSTDGGSSWTLVDTGEMISLAAPILSITSPSSIWAAMSTNTNAHKILGTGDHGTSWETILEGGIYAFTLLSHISELQFCYVVRSMACTTNGGVNWSYPAGPSEYTGLQLLDETYGWAVGFGSAGGLEVYGTSNGGTTWSKLSSLDAFPIRYPSQMLFVSPLHGFLAAGPSLSLIHI